jgi:hypothetical protein
MFQVSMYYIPLTTNGATRMRTRAPILHSNRLILCMAILPVLMIVAVKIDDLVKNAAFVRQLHSEGRYLMQLSSYIIRAS